MTQQKGLCKYITGSSLEIGTSLFFCIGYLGFFLWYL